ncbi:MAG: precorrin-2 dehydrogenase/sirohydrochlorin ferrochelatase family protein [Pikeienuella sp.]
MRYFPMFLDMAERTALLAGGGEQVAQKARLLKRTEARLVIMSEDLIPELATLVDAGRAQHVAADMDEGVIAGAAYVFIATEDEELDLEIADHARAAGALVNMVDRPAECDMITPALVDRDPVVVAIGTEGAAPVLAKAIKTSLEQSLSPELGPFIDMIRRQRDPVADQVDARARLSFWNWAVKGAPWRLWLAGDHSGAEAMIATAAEAGAPPAGVMAGIAMIELPDAPDLTPLRAVQRLQDAVTIFHPADVDEGVLELARRDAMRHVLTECPRLSGDVAAIEKAASEGPVVVLTRPGCERIAVLASAEVICAAASR